MKLLFYETKVLPISCLRFLVCVCHKTAHSGNRQSHQIFPWNGKHYKIESLHTILVITYTLYPIHEYYHFYFIFFFVTECHTLLYCCWSNFQLANYNGNSCAVEMVIHISKTCRLSFNNFYIIVKRSFSRARAFAYSFFSIPCFFLCRMYIRIREIFCHFFIYFSTRSVPHPVCFMTFSLPVRVRWFWYARQRNEKIHETYFALASSFHRRDNWNTDSPFPLLLEWQATDNVLFTGRNDAMPSSWRDMSRFGCYCVWGYQ